MTQLYRFTVEGEVLESTDVWMFEDPPGRVPIDPEIVGEPHDGGCNILRPVNGYIVDLDGVKPAEIVLCDDDDLEIRSHHIDDDCWMSVDTAEAHALRILAAVTKIREAQK